jgi:hypothetical protein
MKLCIFTENAIWNSSNLLSLLHQTVFIYRVGSMKLCIAAESVT